MKDVDLSNLLKAQQLFEEFRQNMVTDRDKAGAIQSYEFCFELAWKTMKRVLKVRGEETGSPKDTFRKAAIEKLIDDPDIWFEFQYMRNLTSHIYERRNVEKILNIFDSFSQQLANLIASINSMSD
jgi:nucleotidyltransferase substrate binding protein (TIGR01987 family)